MTTQPTIVDDALILNDDSADWLADAERADYDMGDDEDWHMAPVLRRAIDTGCELMGFVQDAERTLCERRGFRLRQRVYVADVIVGDRQLEVRFVQTFTERYEGNEGNGGRVTWGWTQTTRSFHRFNRWID